MVCRALLLLLWMVPVACHPLSSDTPVDIQVRVGSVGLDPITETPVVVLKESAGDRALPIWIGVSEARSIAIEMEELHPPRPNTHDLAKRLLGELDATLERVVVTELERGTYFAVMVVRGGGQRLEIDARPSDAIAIALRVEAPVFVRETLFEKNSKPDPHGEAAPELRL